MDALSRRPLPTITLYVVSLSFFFFFPAAPAQIYKHTRKALALRVLAGAARRSGKDSAGTYDLTHTSPLDRTAIFVD